MVRVTEVKGGAELHQAPPRRSVGGLRNRPVKWLFGAACLALVASVSRAFSVVAQQMTMEVNYPSYMTPKCGEHKCGPGEESHVPVSHSVLDCRSHFDALGTLVEAENVGITAEEVRRWVDKMHLLPKSAAANNQALPHTCYSANPTVFGRVSVGLACKDRPLPYIGIRIHSRGPEGCSLRENTMTYLIFPYRCKPGEPMRIAMTNQFDRIQVRHAMEMAREAGFLDPHSNTPLDREMVFSFTTPQPPEIAHIVAFALSHQERVKVDGGWALVNNTAAVEVSAAPETTPFSARM